jgi:hypothetical protein
MNLELAEKMALGLIKRYGVNATFRFNRCTRTFGYCIQGLYTRIELSRPMTRINDIKQVKQTLLHEIAHAKAGQGQGHNDVWKKELIKIGGIPCRYYNDAERVEKLGSVNQVFSGKLVCPSCKKEWHYHRKPKYAEMKRHIQCYNLGLESILKWEKVQI